MTYQLTVQRMTLATAIFLAIALTLFLTALSGTGVALAQANDQGGNSPATGQPTISGTAQVGEKLTADTSGIEDADGLSGETFTYQWVSSDGTSDTDIAGATIATYTPVSADEGQTIKVRVSFTDDADNQEMVTSAPTAAVAAPAQADSEDEPSELSYLTVVVTEDDSDPDNVFTTFTITWNDAEDCSASYNAYLDGVVGDPIHLGSAASEGEQIAASLTNVSAESMGFDAKLYCGMIGSGRLVDILWIPEYSRSFDTVPISRAYLPKPGTYSTEPGLTVLTVSSGTLTPAFHSHTLNYTVPDVANADGRITLTTTKADYYNVAFIPGSLYFYIGACSHGGQQTSLFYTDDTGNPLYPLTDADANTPGFQMELDEGENVFNIHVWPNCASGHVYKLTVTRAANAPANTPATGAPTISGAAQVGETLTASTSGIADADGLTGATFSYQWLSSRDTEIQGATGAVYILVPGDAGKTIKVRVTFTDDEGNAETLTSAATGAVAPRPNSPATGAPTIGGTAQVGQTLTASTSGIADADGLTGATFSYQWLSSRDTEIQGATGTAYILVPGDAGKTIKVRVTFTDDEGNAETLTSAATGAVAPRPNSPATGAPTISGAAQVGKTLTASTSGIADTDGLSGATFSYQWLSSRDTEIGGATSSTYTLVAADEGKSVKVRVSFTDDAGNPETRTSTQTATVEARDNSAGICDRTEQVRDNIIGLLNAQDLGSLGIEDCSEVTDEQLTRIRFLDLAGGGTGGKITSLKSGDFEGLSGMSELNLEDNSLSELPEGVFDGLSSLELLTTQGNDLSSLPDGVFDDLTNLHTLALYDNDLAALPDGVFDGLSKLRTLAISDNKLTALSGDVFTGLGGLTRLVASNNKLTSLPDGVFSGMSKLQSVSFSGNPSAPFTLTAELERQGEDGVVVKVSEGAPFAMTVTLSAEGGTLSATTVVIGGGDTESADVTVTPEGAGAVTVSVDSAAFPDAGTVHDGIQTGVGESLTLEAAASGICDRTAQVRDAILEKLPDTSDCALVTETDLSYLQGSLDLNNSDITTLKSGDFEGLSRLIGIKLRRNNLSALPDGVFDDLGNLTVLYLDANHLSELPAGVFDELSNLVHLYLSFNNNPNPAVYPENTLDEDDLPAGAFGNLSKLRKLDLSDNNLSVLPDGWFTGLTSLVNVKLIGNPGATFTVTAELKQNGGDTVVVKVTQGAPFDMLVTLSAEGGTLATTTVTVEGGSDSSGPVTVTPTGEGGTPVTVSVESVTFQNYQPQHTRGIQAGTGTSLTLNTPATDPVASASNNPATGAPTISGTAQVGETLTAGISGIADADGLGGETFTYQWVSSDGTTDTDIGKATDSTYKLVAADKGNSIKVRVTFTDDGGNEETLTSAATGPVLGDGLPGAPRNLTATPGNKEITLSWDPPDDNGNAPATRYRIEWRMDGKDYKKGHWGPSGSTTYTKTDLANGVKYVFRVKAENGNGNSYGPYGPASEEVSATPTSGLAVDLGTPVLSNTKTLHHGMVKLDWEDVEDAGWYVVQYYHVKGGEWLDLPTAGVDIAFHGSSAVVSNLHGLSWVRVRAASCAGESEWSQIEELYGTNASDWEGVPVPEVAEGDEIEPCPVVLGTPVLSNTETLHHGMVRLDWEDIEDAGWYVVQYYHVKGGEWLDLPAEGVDIAFHGSSAVVSNLHGLSWLRVRAMSCAGASEWSQIEELYGTNASDWEGVPVPEVEEGDEIEPCSEDGDTTDNSPATGAPAISGTAQVGETLTANTSGVVDADGLSNVQYDYQWLADDAAISGATGLTYTLSDVDEDKTVRVRVSFTDDAGNDETLTSAATDAVDARPNSLATGAPTISGTAQVGKTLTANTSGIADADGLTNVAFSYQWLSDDTAIQGATGLTYTLEEADEGKAITVQVSFSDDGGNNETLTSAATDAVSAAPAANNPATGAPTISGTAQVGETLTANTSEIVDEDGLSNVQYEYQWLADDTAIAGATALTYTLVAADEARAISVRVSFTDDAGHDETLTSAATAAVAGAQPTEPPAKPTGLSATASHDSVTLTWDDPGDDTITGYVILRRVRVNNTGGEFSELVADTGTAATTYTDDTVAASTTYTYRIKAINGAGTSERSRWFHIDTPAAPVPDKPTGLEATASHDSVTLTWEDPGDDSITGYVILRRLRYDDPSGHFDELVADTGTAATTYTDDTVKTNTHYTYRIKAINGAGVSERSRWFHIQTQEAP